MTSSSPQLPGAIAPPQVQAGGSPRAPTGPAWSCAALLVSDVDSPWGTPGQQRSLFCNLQVSEEQLAEAGRGLFALDPRAAPSRGCRATLANRQACCLSHHSVSGLREGPWETPPPGPASLWEGYSGEGGERAPLLPKHINPQVTKRKDFQKPSGLGQGGGGWGCPLENLDSDGCRFNKGFPDSGLGALGTGLCRGHPSKGPRVGVAQQLGQASTRPHWGPPRLLSRDKPGPRTKAGGWNGIQPLWPLFLSPPPLILASKYKGLNGGPTNRQEGGIHPLSEDNVASFHRPQCI